jgi:hypothetical protein
MPTKQARSVRTFDPDVFALSRWPDQNVAVHRSALVILIMSLKQRLPMPKPAPRRLVDRYRFLKLPGANLCSTWPRKTLKRKLYEALARN